MSKDIIRLRLMLWCFLFLFIGWLFYMRIVPSGEITYVNNFKNKNFFISRLTPQERIGADGKIIGGPVYFSVFSPRRFDQAKLTIIYKIIEGPKDEIGLIEAGILADKVVWRYDLRPIYYQLFEEEKSGWIRQEEDGVIFLQRQKDGVRQYRNLAEFLNNPPRRQEIAVYNFNLTNDFKINDYQAEKKIRKIDVSLRGNFEVYTYLKEEDLDFSFTIIDLNQNKDSDEIILNLYYQGDLLVSRHLEDDGINLDSGLISQPRIFNFKVSNLPEGLYRLEFKAGNDIIAENIITTQKKIVFINKLWLWGSKQNFKIITNSQTLGAITTNPSSLQKIKIGSSILPIDKTYYQFFSQLADSQSEIIIEKGDIIISGDGVFSFQADEFFVPNYYKLSTGKANIPDFINYVLAGYKRAVKDGDWLVSTVVFDLARAYREKNKYNFLISLPDLRAEENQGSFLMIKEIKIIFSGQNAIYYLKKFF